MSAPRRAEQNGVHCLGRERGMRSTGAEVAKVWEREVHGLGEERGRPAGKAWRDIPSVVAWKSIQPA